MSKKILVIYDKDEPYARSLMEYLCNREEFPYEVTIFTDSIRLQEFAQKSEIELLLVAEPFYEDITTKVSAKQLMILSDSGDQVWKDIQSVEKYQSADNIVREIIQYYVNNTESVPQRRSFKRNVTLIGFFSPVRRCCQTTMGMVLGQILAEKNKTLYLNFESVSGFSGIMGYGNEKDISDLLYFQQTVPQKFRFYLYSCIKKAENLDYIPPMNSMHQLLLARPDQWKKLIKAIVEESDYEYIILDLSEGMQGLFDLLRMCTHVYTLTKDDLYAKAKVEQYEQLLQLCEYEDVLKKTIKRRIPFIKEIPDGFAYCPGGELARYVKNMLKEDGLDDGLCRN